ncbi:MULTISPECIES: enoyl-CoA hydratase-related protein [unclassified Amycolatopsis]|uniref:enoyl-CoA hydratase-related protein n=1 Tax=unclassified Amycolatopsis TaxID=2618356 RepID=UPI001C69E1BA|nr:enoyl-CoA hydratase-related protein [Amycolatopsis sp. DSM 110486]QYN18432.1 enoyl-CoA hydratase/isomerase family protein [Amycolatopsis sp. DSM 110486]
MSEFVFEDPGTGGRLGDEVRTALAHEIRGWRRATPGAVLLRVHADAWHHAPEVASARLDRDRVDAGYQSLVKDLFGLACPVVVALDGRVSGFGLALALAADVRVATGRTTLAVGDLNAAALLGGTGWLLGRASGTGTFAQLAWTGETLSAEEGFRRGLVSPGDAEAARALAQRLAADPAGSSALKRALTTRQRGELETVLDYEAWLAEVAAGGAG